MKANISAAKASGDRRNEGAMPDIQAAIDKAFSAGGGTVWIPRGTVTLKQPLLLRSRVRLLGQGQHGSRLKLADGVKAQAVVMSAGFNPDANLWTYRAGRIDGTQPTYAEPDGLHMGCVVENLTIDGNRRGGAVASGLCLYGGGYRVEHVGILDCTGHGFWSQCGRAGNSWHGDAEYRYANIHESLVDDLAVCDVGGHGVLWRGPNDSYMDRVQVKMARRTGVLIDTGSNFEPGGLKIGTMHAYSTGGPTFHIRASYTTADYLHCDTPGTEGLMLSGSCNSINRVVVSHHNRNRDNSTWGVVIWGEGNHIGYLRYRNSQQRFTGDLKHGGALKIGANAAAWSVRDGFLDGGGEVVTVKGTPIMSSGDTRFGGVVRDW